LLKAAADPAHRRFEILFASTESQFSLKDLRRFAEDIAADPFYKEDF
jgi:hypothetical protein